MKTQNHIQLIGYLGKDPVVGSTTSGSLFALIRMATDFYRKKEDESVYRKTTWHEVVAWGKLAESVSANFIKGSHILVEGMIQYRTYQDRNDHTRYVTEIRASKLLNLDR